LGALKTPKNLAQPKKRGKNKATPLLNVFKVPDSESEVRISIKKIGSQVIKFDDFVCLQLYCYFECIFLYITCQIHLASMFHHRYEEINKVK